jgi:hypothetical protein
MVTQERWLPELYDGEGQSRARSRWPTAALLGILAGFIALASFIALKTPAWESVDEPSHVQNIEALVSGHWYGMNSNCQLRLFVAKPYFVHCSGLEAQQAPLYYLVLAGWQTLVGLPPHTYAQPHSTDLMDPTSTPVISHGALSSQGVFSSAKATQIVQEQGLFLHHNVDDLAFSALATCAQRTSWRIDRARRVLRHSRNQR